MRYALLLTALVAALAAASSALADSGTGVAPDRRALPPLGESVTTLVSGPTRIAPSDIPGGGVGSVAGGGGVKGAAATPAAFCGACIVTCWGATARNGPGDWSGHVYIYQHLYWCGNGAVVTYATASQTYEQEGWYSLSSAYGPWWSGGGAGSANVRASGYILWSWKTPLISISHSGTTYLNSTMWAYGAVTF
jgi:hypothetical protein